MSLFLKDSRNIYRVTPLLRFEWLEHGFGTRRTTAWDGDSGLVSLRQIHSDICVRVDGRAGRIAEGDALLTAATGALLTVRTADCLPILMVDERNKAVAAVHAGWRGTVRGIAAKAVAEMRRLFSSNPGDLHAAIGPGIGACCYEVGPEVGIQFQELFPERSDLSGPARIDLAEANRRELSRAGILPERLYLAGRCTRCEAEDFYSWRRDRSPTGRMLSAIRILP